MSFPPGVKETIDWLQGTFAWWYDLNPPPMPDRFTRREFGFILWPDKPGPPPFIRHRAYANAEGLHGYLAKRGVHSAYYSTAYYRAPGELKMADKQWLGAELIFDLDADHLEEAEAAKARGQEMPIEDQLKIVKDQFRRLLDEFLFGDFGLTEKDVFITFSGGRGYHAHVVDPKLMSLDAKARREIVDYVTAKVPAKKGSDEPDLSPFLWEKSMNVGTDRFPRIQSMLETHPETTPGWPGRITRTLADTIEENVLRQPKEDAVAWLSSFKGIGEKRAASFVDKLNDKKVEAIRRGHLGIDSQGVFKTLCPRLIAQQALPFAKGETDEPVTADVKRLIRLPGSLHGKSGLQVVTLTRDTLDGFDPFRDAVAFPLDAVPFVPRNDATVTLAGETVTVRAGQETEVPMPHAVWWCSRQQGTVPGPTVKG